jgi:hypothetical protein
MRRGDVKQSLIHSLMVKSGYLHMLLRYALVLKQDTGLVQIKPFFPFSRRENVHITLLRILILNFSADRHCAKKKVLSVYNFSIT